MPVHPVELLDEAFLGELGIHRLEIPVPFIEAGGPANVYAIENEDRTFTLFDTGIGNTEGQKALREGLARLGIEPRRISRLIISHGHIDHYGNAQRLSEESGAPVFIHDADREKICGDGLWSEALKKHRPALLELGIPSEEIDRMVAALERNRTPPPQVARDRVHSISGGAHLRFRMFDAEVLHLPGHTPGLICLYARDQQLLFADDHVLARVSPNPLLDFSQGTGATKFRALSRYLEGAKFVHALDLKGVLPGHGPSFRGHKALLEGLFDFYTERQRKLLARLEQGPASTYELVPAIFARPNDLSRQFLMVSEVLGNLEVLEDTGRLVRRIDSGIARYHLPS